MRYEAVITKWNFHPMVEVVPSSLDLWVYISHFDNEFMLSTESGSIEYLSAKFGFKIVNSHEWDFTGIEGRKCVVEGDNLNFRFRHYI